MSLARSGHIPGWTQNSWTEVTAIAGVPGPDFAANAGISTLTGSRGLRDEWDPSLRTAAGAAQGCRSRRAGRWNGALGPGSFHQLLLTLVFSTRMERKAVRSNFWADVGWGLRETWRIGGLLMTIGLIVFVLRGLPSRPGDLVASLAGILAVGVYISFVGAIIGALRPTANRGKVGAALTGATCGLLVMLIVAVGMALGGAEAGFWGYIFLVSVGVVMGAVFGLAYVEGRAASDGR